MTAYDEAGHLAAGVTGLLAATGSRALVFWQRGERRVVDILLEDLGVCLTKDRIPPNGVLNTENIIH